jgi:hypothetical protein
LYKVGGTHLQSVDDIDFTHITHIPETSQPKRRSFTAL